MKNVFKNPFSGFVKKKKQEIVVNEIDNLIEAKGQEIIDFLKQAGKDLALVWAEMEKEVRDVAQQVGLNTELIETNHCSFPELCGIIKRERVKGSDQAVIVKDKYEERQRYIISFMKDGEYITPASNRYIILITDTVDADFRSLFKNTNIVKLK